MTNIRLSKSSISTLEKTAVLEILESEFLGMGLVTQQFENDLADYLGVTSDCIASVNTGTSALHIALSALGVGVGDEVLVPSLTYVASFQVISATGAKPIACEIVPNTLFIDVDDARTKVTSNTKAIMPVHYASACDGIEGIYKLAEEFNLRVIEDAAQAFGSEYKGQLVGSFGDIICFSFDGIKNITCGEGGAIISKDQTLITKIKDARLLGVEKDTNQRFTGKRSWNFDVTEQGFRYHLSNINAAIGCVQLKRIVEFRNKRREIAYNYSNALIGLEEVTVLDFNFEEIMPHIFVVLVKRRDELRAFLIENNVECGVHYKPNHLLTKFAQEGDYLPVTESVYSELLTLPCHFDLTLIEQNIVINLIKVFYEQ